MYLAKSAQVSYILIFTTPIILPFANEEGFAFYLSIKFFEDSHARSSVRPGADIINVRKGSSQREAVQCAMASREYQSCAFYVYHIQSGSSLGRDHYGDGWYEALPDMST